MTTARIYSDPFVLRRCVRCGHYECPFCRDHCDRCFDDEDSDHHKDCAREMECSFDREPDPRLNAFLERARKEFGEGLRMGEDEHRLWAEPLGKEQGEEDQWT